MKVLLAVSALLGLAVATTPCEDCTAIVTALAKYLTSEESMARQVEILLADVCPSTENPDDCVARLPDFWMQVGAVLWPGYYDPTAEWMCATDDICGAPEFKKRLSLKYEIDFFKILIRERKLSNKEYTELFEKKSF